MTYQHTHVEIGHFVCDSCHQWVWGRNVGRYIDVIEVNRKNGTAYTAYYSGEADRYGTNTWATNVEVNLEKVESILGWTLPDGRIEPWVRLAWW